QPGHIVLLSPVLDVTLSNPWISILDKIDPFLGVQGLQWCGGVYARNVDSASYLASPVNGSLKGLAPITLFIGTRDILLPDCRKLRDKAQSEGVALSYYEYVGMVHDWMLLVLLPEAKQVLEEIVRELNVR